jgi:glucose-6-phosphate dehydrogenase assembly protein OpcA
MNARQHDGNLGTPVEVDVAAIETELRSLWKTASEREGEAAAIRACSCNLLTVVRDEREAGMLMPVIAKVAEYHPCRAVIAYSRSRPDGSHLPPMRAWISAQCAIRPGGGPQICSEVVTLESNTASITDLLSTVLPLLVPDLQIILYWRSPRLADARLIEDLESYGHLLVVDSHALDLCESRAQLFASLLQPKSGIAVRDLNWARLTVWRELLAGLFDTRDARARLHGVSDVVMHHSGICAGRLPTGLLLLAGWLASSLEWSRAACERSGDGHLVRWHDGVREVRMTVASVPCDPHSPTGIEKVELRTESGDSFLVGRESGAGCARAVATTGDRSLTCTVPMGDPDEAGLLIEELSITGTDRSYQSALAAALQLEECLEAAEQGQDRNE